MGPFDIAEYRRWLLDAGRKPSTVNRALGVLSQFFAWALKNSLASEDPASGLRRVPEAARPPRALGRREQLALLRAVQRRGKPRDIAFVTLLLHTGLRVSEACALAVDDVFIGERSGRVVVRRGKGDKLRKVPLNVTARRALLAWLAVQGTGPGFLFTSQRGERLTRRGAEHLTATPVRDASLRRFAQACLEAAPAYFCRAPASTSGKHHPPFARGPGGLVRHTKAAVRVFLDLAEAYPCESGDACVVALLIHDTLKCGLPPVSELKTVAEHPLVRSRSRSGRPSSAACTPTWAGGGRCGRRRATRCCCISPTTLPAGSGSP